jgi:hypothetical protein
VGSPVFAIAIWDRDRPELIRTTPRSCTTSTLSFEVMQIIETLDSVEPPEDVHAADSARI